MDDFGKFLDKALYYLSFRPRSEKEVRDNLLKKKATPEVIDRVLNSLNEQNFLNDQDFTRWFIDQRIRFKPKSVRIIKLELRQKGISQEIIEQAFANLEKNEESESPTSDLDSAKKLVERKIDRYRDLPKQQIYQKLGAFLARRGYDWDTIKKSIDDGLNNEI